VTFRSWNSACAGIKGKLNGKVAPKSNELRRFAFAYGWPASTDFGTFLNLAAESASWFGWIAERASGPSSLRDIICRGLREIGVAAC
jgi:hypothetical protein